MFDRRKVEDELVPAARDLGFGMVTWSPLKYGLLSGKYNNGLPEEKTRLTRATEWGEKVITEERVESVRRLTALADEIGATTAQLAIAWLLRIPEVSSVITGATRLEHLDDNLKALEFVEMLSSDILDTIEAILDNSPGETEEA